MKARTMVWVVGLSAALVVGIVLLVGFLLGPKRNVSPEPETECFGISCPSSEDIVNGRITVNASQYNFYQFSIPYGAQDIDVHAQWSSGGGIDVYVVNATELIDWQNGNTLVSFYKSSQLARGDLSLQLPPDDLYYLVFDNTNSAVQKNVQTSSGVSFMCSLCGSSAPVRQPNPSYPACVPLDGNEVCTVNLSNVGSVDATPTGVCIESWSLHEGPAMSWGTPHVGVFSPMTQLPHSSNLTATCTVSGTTAPLALAITIQIPFANGPSVLMYGPVSLNSPTCTRSGANLICSFSINNDVASGVVATGCQIQVGDNVKGWVGTIGGTTVFDTANRGGIFTCTVAGSEPAIGTPVTGIVSFGNGSYAPFVSKWS